MKHFKDWVLLFVGSFFGFLGYFCLFAALCLIVKHIFGL